MSNSQSALKSWIPYKISQYQDTHLCHWLNTFNEPYDEPFFDGTLAKIKALRHSHSLNVVSELQMLAHWAPQKGFIEPTAFIFHVSRCGSTLMSQLLGLDNKVISLAEVPFFDNLMRLPYQHARYIHTDVEQLLPCALNFYGQQRIGEEQYLVIKTDSWHVFLYQQLRKLYPLTPFILLYRQPAQVFASHAKQRGMQAVPGLIEPQIFGFAPGEAEAMNQDQYLAEVISRYYKQYLTIARQDPMAILVNYEEGMMPIIERICPFINYMPHGDVKKKMAERSLYHSKHPAQVFSGDLVQTVSPYLQYAQHLYQQLEHMRITG
jgi:hypothetical protein